MLIFFLIFFLTADAMAAQPTNTTVLFKKQLLPAGSYVSPVFNTKNWVFMRFEFTNTPSEWLALKGFTFTFSIDCSFDGFKTSFQKTPPNTFRGGSLGALGTGLPSYTHAIVKGEDCRANVTTNQNAVIGIQVTG